MNTPASTFVGGEGSISPARQMPGGADNGSGVVQPSPPWAPMKPKRKPDMRSTSETWNKTRKELFKVIRKDRVEAEHASKE